jgi:hypothetical protein
MNGRSLFKASFAMARTASEYAVHLLIEGGHREEVRFTTFEDFQKWYTAQLKPNLTATDLLNVPIRGVQNEFLVVRPSAIVGIRVEPIFAGSVDRYG